MADEPRRRVKIRDGALLARNAELLARVEPIPQHPRDVEFEAFCALGRARRKQSEILAFGLWRSPKQQEELDAATEECVRLEREYAEAKRLYEDWKAGQVAAMGAAGVDVAHA